MPSDEYGNLKMKASTLEMSSLMAALVFAADVPGHITI
jgi:hypothetical protein